MSGIENNFGASIELFNVKLREFSTGLQATAREFEGLKEVKRSLTDINSSFGKFGETLKELKKQVINTKGIDNLTTSFKKIIPALSGLEPLAKKMGGNKFKKGVKAMGGLMGSIMKSSAQAWAMARLMTLMEPFISLLDLFNPIFEVMAAIFQEALMPVIIELIPYIMMATTWLMENKAAIIQVINVLMPLLLIFHLLKGNFDDLQVIMIPLTVVVDALTVAWKWLVETALKPAYNFLINIFGPVWTWLMDNALKPVYDYLVGEIKDAFDDFIDWLEWLEDGFNDVIDIIDELIGWIEDIPSLPSFGGGGGGGGDDDDDFNLLDPSTWATGGLTKGATNAIIGEAGTEAVVPLETSNPFTDAIEEMAYAQNKTLIVLEEIRDGQYKAKGLNRRRFG